MLNLMTPLPLSLPRKKQLRKAGDDFLIPVLDYVLKEVETNPTKEYFDTLERSLSDVNSKSSTYVICWIPGFPQTSIVVERGGEKKLAAAHRNRYWSICTRAKGLPTKAIESWCTLIAALAYGLNAPNYRVYKSEVEENPNILGLVTNGFD